MRVAQVCTPYIAVPPTLYGGLERVVSYLTEALVHEGHDVTLFASGDSITKAKLVSPTDHAPGIGSEGKMLHLVTLATVMKHADDFDIVHFHLTDWTLLPFVKALRVPTLITFHMPFDLSPASQLAFDAYADVPIVSISDAQRCGDARLFWQATVYNGLPKTLYSLEHNTSDHFAFLGRLGVSKAPDIAIDIATAANVSLKLAGPVQQPFFDEVIAPKLIPGQIEYLGELNDAGKQEFLGAARALLFPTRIEEAFGFVMIEALACGTPVVAFDRGAAREIVTEGATGFIVSNVEYAAARLSDTGSLSRGWCRAEFEARFTAAKMCQEYCAVYERIASLR